MEGSKCMDDKTLVLMNSIRRDLEAIAAIYDELERHSLTLFIDRRIETTP